MGLKLQSVTFDCADPNAVARFWSEVLDSPIDALDDPDVAAIGHATGQAPVFYFQRVPEPLY